MIESSGFGTWLREQRKLLGLTTKELGERTGCSATTIEKIEMGTRLPSLQLARLFADFFAVPPEEREAFLRFSRRALPTAPAPGEQVGASGHPIKSEGASDNAPWRAGMAVTRPASPQVRISNNLPNPLTSFVGREVAIEELTALLERPAVRLLSLTGPPGVGKTRVALQAALSSLHLFPDGIFFVGLAHIRDPDLVPSAIARVLGVRETAETLAQDALKERLREGRILLLLDNFEQVMAAGPLLSDLLSASLRLKALVTTREVLDLYGEYNFPVPQLDVPPLEQLPDLTAGELSQYEAVRLFAERASAARHGFQLTGENARSIAEICIWLDGLPLGIELAASQMRDLSLQEVKSRLAEMSSKLDLLVGGPRDLPPRQQALRSAIEWSYGLLNEEDAMLFRRVSVFAGSFTVEAVSVVCKQVIEKDHAWDIEESASTLSVDEQVQLARTRDNLQALCDKSLLYRQGASGEERFWMLETLRGYAQEQLAVYGDEDAMLNRHASYYLALMERAEPLLLRGDRQGEWLVQLEREHGNLLAALGYMVGHAPELALHMSGVMWPFWEMHGHISEWQRWIEQVLDKAPTTRTKYRAEALHAAGRLSALQGDYVRARTRYEESLAIRREIDDKIGISSSLNNLGIISMERGDYSAAMQFYRESLQLRRELGDRYGVAALLNNMANILIAQGDYVEARLMHEESLTIRKQLDNPYGVASSLQNLGLVAMYEGDYTSAVRCLNESLALRRELGYKHGIASLLSNLGQVDYYRKDYISATKGLKESLSLYLELDDNQSIAECLIGLGEIAVGQENMQRAARLFGAADAQMASLGFKLLAWEQAEFERNVLSARTQLGEESWVKAWTEGNVRPLSDAVAYVLEQDTSGDE